MDYVPNKYIVESKSFKLYLLGYRNHGAFHEDCTISIAQDIVNLLSPQWLRNIKSKKYSKFRIDLIFNKKKYNDIFYVLDGGWHFTCIRTPEELEKKLLNFAHHYEFEQSGLKLKDLKKLILEKRIMYDHNLNKESTNKWSGITILKKISSLELPEYINLNNHKYKEWLD